MTVLRGDTKLNADNLKFAHFAVEWMTDFSFDWRLIGTLYLCDAIAMAIKEGDTFFERSFTKDVLPSIAKRRQTTWRAAERAMRYAIESAWLRAFPEILTLYFPQDFEKTGRPSVKQFVRVVGLAAHRDWCDKNRLSD